MPKYGLLIDYGYCVGCHTCEMACTQEHNRPEGEWGIRVQEVAPEISGGKRYYVPFPTDKCKLCGKRVARGQMPSCVKHCQSGVITFGRIEALANQMRQNAKNGTLGAALEHARCCIGNVPKSGEQVHSGNA